MQKDLFEELEEVVLSQDLDPEGPRIIGLYGDLDEERASEITYSLMSLHADGGKKKKPIEFIISTGGGDAYDMFSVYDIMRMVKRDCEIHCFGIGKVMSAGVLLLAAGTKGKRRVGKNCRVMIHNAKGSGLQGSVSEIEQGLAEVSWTQERYFACLAKETNLSVKKIRKIISKKTEVYLTAKEAVEYGIADKIV